MGDKLYMPLRSAGSSQLILGMGNGKYLGRFQKRYDMYDRHKYNNDHNDMDEQEEVKVQPLSKQALEKPIKNKVALESLTKKLTKLKLEKENVKPKERRIKGITKKPITLEI